MRRKGICYKCKKEVEFNIPYVSKDYKMYKALCECGHEMVTATIRDPERQREFNEAVSELRDHLKENGGTFEH